MEKPAAGVWVPAEVLGAAELSPGEKLLYSAVLGLSQEKGYCYATNGYLAALLGCSVDRVRRTLYRLVGKGCLRSVFRQEAETPQERRLYPLALSDHPLDKNAHPPWRKNASPPGQKQPAPLAKNDHQNNIINNKEENKEKNTPHPPRCAGGRRSGERSSDFERFWAVYPKKVDKQSARKAFEAVTVPLETLLTALERQKCSALWNRENGRYIPLPANWLNRERWEDDLGGNANDKPILDHSRQTRYGLVL